MNVGELKKLIADLPDDLEVLHYGSSEDWSSLDLDKVETFWKVATTTEDYGTWINYYHHPSVAQVNVELCRSWNDGRIVTDPVEIQALI